jgi:hypothetical protein
VLATAAAIVAAFLIAPIAMADGLPTPLPGAIAGPDVQTLLDIASAYHLECQSTVSPGAPAETFCLRPGGTGALTFTLNFYDAPTLLAVAGVSGPAPFTQEADDFLTGVGGAFCTQTEPDTVRAFATTTRLAPPPPGETAAFDDVGCHLDSTYADVAPNGSQTLTAFSSIGFVLPSLSPIPTAIPTPLATQLPTIAPPPSAQPSPTPTTTPSPTPTPTPLPASETSGSDTHPTAFVESIPAPAAVSNDPLVIAESIALAALIVLLMPFPAQLFNSTLESNYDEVRRWFRLDAIQRGAGRLAGFWESTLGIVVFVLLAALIYGFLDPGFSFDVTGLAAIVGLALGIALTTLLASATTILGHARLGDRGRLRALPATLLVGLVCVLISRVTGFLPGYVYGIVLGFVFARTLSRIEDGRTNAIAAASMLGVALVAWVLLSMVVSQIAGPVGVVFSTLLATLVVAGLEGVVFGLLPFRFLPGEPLYATNRIAWAALLGLGAFLFFHILINPASGYLSSTSRTPLFTIIVLFVSFAVLSVAFWAYFRKREPASPVS